MTGISEEEQATVDWDWYAVDRTGNIGHFTSAGMRKLPASVKHDKNALLELKSFFEGLPERSLVSLSDRAQQEVSSIKDESKREWRVRDLVGAAGRGLFSYDTVLESDGDYFVIALPKRPLTVQELPVDIQRLLLLTRATELFENTPTFPESVTLRW